MRLYRDLLERDALRPRRDGSIALGPAAPDALARLGVDLDTVEPAPSVRRERAGGREVRLTAAGRAAV